MHPFSHDEYGLFSLAGVGLNQAGIVPVDAGKVAETSEDLQHVSCTEDEVAVNLVHIGNVVVNHVAQLQLRSVVRSTAGIVLNASLRGLYVL
jgi:hypothetical protein